MTDSIAVGRDSDRLTGLPNRYRLMHDLEELQGQMKTETGDGALILFDLDDFRMVNDTYGYRFADRYILTLSDDVFRSLVPPGGTLYRIGGDTFAVLWLGASREQVHHLTLALLDEMRKTRHIAGVECKATVSIGAALFPADGDSAEKIFRNADITLFWVKRRGKNSAAFYASVEREEFLSQIDFETALRTSVAEGLTDFEVYYQPTVDAVTGSCNGAEALLRWVSPRNVNISPADVVMHLERIGCIETVGDWVIRNAVRQCADWRENGLPDFSIHVNLSMMQLRDRVLEEKLLMVLNETGLPPDALVLEVTESAIMHDLSSNIAILNSIRRHGIRIALDDFGSGYSSINYLRKLPIDQIKIDRSFVADIANGYNRSLSSTIKDLAHSIHLTVCDEGIEELDQYDRLEPAQGDIIQGYLFGKPMPAQIFKAFLRDNRNNPPRPAAAGNVRSTDAV